jgi:hypothetical protein
MTTTTMFVGVDGEKVVSGAETEAQIAAVCALECALRSSDGSEAVTWLDCNDPAEPRTLFQCILVDRRRRVDAHTFMADRPAFAVVTAVDGRVVRLEFYEGHDALECTFDLRSAELQGKSLPRFMDVDPQAYDPAAILADVFGLPPEITRPVIEATHDPDTPGLYRDPERQ